MKNLKRIFYILIISSSIFVNAKGQTHTPRYNTSLGVHTNGYYEYLPQGYNNSEVYPLIVFFCGIGELGSGNETDLPKVLANGTPMQIRNGTFPTSFNVRGKNFKFIVITPQFTQNPSAQEISEVLDNIVSRYRVDLNRIYLTGLSLGGGMVWRYASNSKAYADRIAAIVPVCGAEWINSNGGDFIAQAKLPVWATHNNGDNVVSVESTNNNVNNVNNAPHIPTPSAKKTIFETAGHDAWTKTYDLNFKENNNNIYEWMLTYKRDIASPLPVTGLSFNVQKNQTSALLQWSTVSESNNRGFVVERSSNGTSWDSLAFVVSTSPANGAQYSYTDLNPGSNSVYYRLKQVDIDGHFSYSVIRMISFNSSAKISVYPNPVRSSFKIISEKPIDVNAKAFIYNYSGKLVRKLNSNELNNPVNVNNLLSGNYFIKLENGDEKIQVSFIKI